LGAVSTPLVDGELVPQGEDLDLQRRPRTADERQAVDDGNQDGSHGHRLIDVAHRTQCRSPPERPDEIPLAIS